jgi:hypothetical protein
MLVRCDGQLVWRDEYEFLRPYIWGSNQEEEKGTTMDKNKFCIHTENGALLKKGFETEDAAVESAKRYAKEYDCLYISQAIAVVKSPVPEAQVTKLT